MRGDSVGKWIFRRRLIFRKTSLFWSLLVIIIMIDIYYLSIDVTLKVSAGAVLMGQRRDFLFKIPAS